MSIASAEAEAEGLLALESSERMLSVSVVWWLVLWWWSLLRLLAVGRVCLVFLLVVVLLWVLWEVVEALPGVVAVAVRGLVPPPDEDLVLLL